MKNKGKIKKIMKISEMKENNRESWKIMKIMGIIGSNNTPKTMPKNQFSQKYSFPGAIP